MKKVTVTASAHAGVHIQDVFPAEGTFTRDVPAGTTKSFFLTDGQYNHVRPQLDAMITAGLLTSVLTNESEEGRTDKFLELKKVAATMTVRTGFGDYFVGLDGKPYFKSDVGVVYNLGMIGSDPIVFKGAIAVNTDFPRIADVKNGWLYRVTSSVTDDAGVTYTNTLQSFPAGSEIAWNGTSWTELGDAAVKGAMIYVDGNRTDTYTADGSQLRPYKTLTAAAAASLLGDVLKVAPKVAGYTEAAPVVLPASVSIEGYQGYRTKINSDLITGNAPCSLKDLEFSAAQTLFAINAVSMRDCWSYGQVVLPNAASAVNAYNCYVTATAKPAIVMNGASAEWFQVMGQLSTTGDFNVILGTQGEVMLDLVEVSSPGGATKAAILSSSGSVKLFNTSVVNAGGGRSIDADNGAGGSNPNVLNGVITVGETYFGSTTTLVGNPVPVPTSGTLRRVFVEGSTVLAGATTVLSLNIPSNAKVVGAQFRVDDLVTSGDGGTSWGAAFSGGSVSVLAALAAFALNTKIDKMLTGEVVSALTQITFSCNGGTFSGGTIRAIVYYDELQGMRDA